jgi:Holliday junction resolvase RusA-like endonuclease
VIKLRVYGTPVPQGSTRAFAVRKGGAPTGRVVVTGDNTKTKSWRQKVVDEARSHLAARAEAGRCGLCDRLDTHTHGGESLAVNLIFILPRPAVHYGRGRNAGSVKDSAPRWPATKPDLDKLCRAVLDALTDAGVWRDDSQVVMLSAGKMYGRDDSDRPGCEIEVSTLG